MEVRLSYFVKTNGIKAAVMFLLMGSSASQAEDLADKPLFNIVRINLPLTVYPIPVQNALANSDFNFNIKSSLSMMQPEVDYRVTNLYTAVMENIESYPLPNGLTRVYEGEGVCPKVFTLYPNQSCILRFYVDKTKYRYRKNKGWMLVWPPHLYAWRPAAGSRYDNVVASAPEPTQALVTPSTLNGLKYDPASMSIVGKPANIDVYHFQISASNGSQTAVPGDLEINVEANPKDTPKFKDKSQYTIHSAMPGQNYRLNLMDLIEPTPGFAETNQISFRIDKNHDWLSIDRNNASILQGIAPSAEAGTLKEITLIATSNSGGDSKSMTIQIPIAYDPEKKPVIKKGAELTGVAGELFHNDLRKIIIDPAKDSSLKIIVDKIVPAAPWLFMSTSNPTELRGEVPATDWGREYQVTLRADTVSGGSSEAVTIPLQIAITQELTPHFYTDNPQLPLFYVGQSYEHDFVSSEDITPRYSDFPYTIELEKGHDNPSWVRIENNKLIVDSVPDGLKPIEEVFITIKNVPGGQSSVLTLQLFIMN